MNWSHALRQMRELASLEKNQKTGAPFWKYGQEDSIRWVADQLGQKDRNGVIVADEVGMGKTRVVMAAILAVLQNGGGVAAVVPPGLLYQWKKEWTEFLGGLKDKKSRSFSPVLLRSYYSLFDYGELEFPLSRNRGRWLLLSHQFGPPRLANNSRGYRYLLPAVVKALQQHDQGKHHHSHWQFVKDFYNGDVDCIGADCRRCPERVNCDVWFSMTNKAAQYLRKGKRWHLFRDIPDRALQSESGKEEFKWWFNSDNGIAMLGELLGPMDLVVIDEAHKNRGETSRLEIGLSSIKMNPSAKRIAMTATPMELSPEQWKDLFNRIDETCPEKAISEFNVAHKNANKCPDNIEVVSCLIDKSKRFRSAMKPYVTRRLRIKQAETLSLLGIKDDRTITSAHPHRFYDREIKIAFAGMEDSWKPSVVALEAIAKAAKGCSSDNDDLQKILRLLRIADSRYAAGQLPDITSSSLAYEEARVDKTISAVLRNTDVEDLSTYDKGKLQRVQYWRSVLRKKEIDLSGHPRVQSVADEIDRIVWSKGGRLKPDKVLVFGTFKKPLKALVDVLNRRSVLRFLDRKGYAAHREPPIPGATGCVKHLDILWSEYERIRSDNELGLLRSFSSESELREALMQGGRTYESIRSRLTTHINRDFVRKLPGDAAIRSSADVAELLRARLINALICSGHSIDSLKPAEIKNKALNIWAEYLESYFDKNEEDIDRARPKTKWKTPDYFIGHADDITRLRELDRIADNLGEDDITSMVEDEMDHISGRIEFFARILDGDVTMETRRVLQAQFNAHASFPSVLVAQSQVGREGLNLHKACRTVIQFHSEWNPGVVEQQIGRVDRIDSYWEKMAREFNDRSPGESVASPDFPRINIEPVIFVGTYDHFQHNVSKHRRETLNANLFGELLGDEARATIEKLPKEGAWKDILHRLAEAAPEFLPPVVGNHG